jgi:uncharacterized protein YgbK (DUF1537 family)
MTAARVGWYGDDFTGATDTLSVLAQAGLRTMLFLGVPDASRLSQASRALGGELDAIGIAGAARAMVPAAMASELEPVGAFFAQAGVRVLHYKVCSTFDSAPEVGSIGAAIRTLRPFVDLGVAAIVGGQPSLGRYCAFSNLFAAAGAGGRVERIDRHPTMSRHPVTPMHEADLRKHLALQGVEPVGALHYPAYSLARDAQDSAWSSSERGSQAVLMDVAEAAHLAPVGRLLWKQATARRLLAVGPSSVAQALVAHWRDSGERLDPSTSTTTLAPATLPVFVLAGSLSPITAQQVRAATSYETVAIDTSDLLEGVSATRDRITALLAQRRHVLAFSAPHEAASADTRQSASVADANARLLRAVVDAQAARGTPLRRIGIAGGDTSSLATRALGGWGLSYAGTLGAGVAISRMHADDAALDGVELVLKGGQMGTTDVFERLLC